MNIITHSVNLKGERKQTIYIFSKRSPKSETPSDLPYIYTVGVNKPTNLPYLKKK